MNLKALDELIKRYPYCQNGQILYAVNLCREENLQYAQQIKKAAAYSGDRRKLKELIDRARNKPSPVLASGTTLPMDETEPSPIPSVPISPGPHAATRPDEIEIVQAETAPQTKVETTIAFPLERNTFSEEAVGHKNTFEDPIPDKDHITPDELLSMVRKRLALINAEKHPIPVQDIENQFPGTPKKQLNKKTLIDQFIQDEPRISKPTTAFFNPSESAHRSNIDEEEIVSETLAQLYAKQGNISKAIQIYKKLSLLNQEKSRYFAAQIEKLTA